MTCLPAVTLVPGRAEAPLARLAEPLSFWGGYDAASGRIIDRWHPDLGRTCAGLVLMMTAGRGSSSGSSVLAEALRRGTGPAAIILAERDPILVTGALVAAELYGTTCPIVVARLADWAVIGAAGSLAVEAGASAASLLLDDCVAPAPLP